jgi:SAM-dependent methyltransferase
MRQLTADEHFAELGASYEADAFRTAGHRWISEREVGVVMTALSDLAYGARVLDVGAGNGRIARVLVDRGASVVAADSVPEMLESLRERVPDATPLLARLGERLPLDDGTFDAVIAMRVLKWVPDWRAAVRELARVLVPGGLIVLEITNRRSLARFGYRGAPISLCTVREVRDEGRAAGVTWTAAHPGSHLPHACWSAARGSGALRACTALQKGADALLGTRGARSVLLVGRKG